MNITEQKNIDEILGYISPNESKIGILGCGSCATTCQTGGELQVNKLKEVLEVAGKEVVFTTVVDTLCDERLTRKALKPILKGEIIVDAILSMGCGSGNSVVNDLLEVPVYPTNDSLFLGSVKKIGLYEEKCSLCGECITYRTGGICPVTRCPKGLMNGPCGGSYGGRCEVDSNRNCAWVMIYERLKTLGKLDQMSKYNAPKSFRHVLKPQKIDKGKK